MCSGVTGRVSTVSALFSPCVSPDFKAGEAATKKREDKTKGFLGIK